ncbi:UNVERIFIED_CONTAM: Isoprene synthase, chloroplastic [Sesamum radiatum]|uniref:Isoprene synthase, chloroplastic n=1 Tax=Sesamum radiatum TaxID=300843 RepID=A0AAW2UNN0_SESRA
MKQAFLPSNLQLMRWKIQCTAAQQSVSYQPSSWSYDFIQSIGNDHMNHVMEIEEDARKKMEDEVRCMLENEDVEPLVLIELIDDIDRLGIVYRFQETIDRALERVLLQSSQVEQKMHENLHSCALCFRVLRRHGYLVSTDIFDSFKDSNGNFTTSLATDVEGMLSLYEASHLALDGESTLDEAREFTSFHLKNMLLKMDMRSAMRVSRALELPSHHRMQRLEARWNIEMYDKQNKANQLLHKLATLDFNLVQKVHQQDLQEASRWDVNAVNDLPDYMKLFFFALYNTVNDMAYDTLKEQDQVIISQLKKVDDVTRGETAKAVSCYMHETGASDEVACAYIGKLIDQNWKMINKENTYNSALFGKCFIQTAQNLARIALCQYQQGDAHTAPTDGSRNRVKSVIMEPIHFMK